MLRPGVRALRADLAVRRSLPPAEPPTLPCAFDAAGSIPLRAAPSPMAPASHTLWEPAWTPAGAFQGRGQGTAVQREGLGWG